MLPPFLVNLSALDCRLSKIYYILCISLQIILLPKPSKTEYSLTPRNSALSFWIRITSFTASLGSNIWQFFLNLPDLSCAKSRMSFTRKHKIFELDSWTFTVSQLSLSIAYSSAFTWLWCISSKSFYSKKCILSLIWPYLMLWLLIELMGFLISWDTVTFINALRFLSPEAR